MNKTCLWLGFGLLMSWVACKQDVSSPSEDLAPDRTSDQAVYMEDYLPPDHPWGFLDSSGQVAVEAKFDALGEFSEGLCAANEHGLWGYIDRSGTWVINAQYKGAGPFQEGRAAVWLFGNSYNFIQRDGQTITSDSVWEDVGPFLFGRAKVRVGTYWGYTDKQGTLIIPATFDQADDFSERGARVQKDNRWGLIDSVGQYIISPKYDHLKISQSGLIWVQNEKKWSIFGSENQTFDQFVEGSANVFYARKDQEWHLINHSGKILKTVTWRPVSYLGEKRWAFLDQGKFGLCDDSAQVVLPATYDQINSFSEGLAACRVDYAWGYMNVSGQQIIPLTYGLAWDFKEGLARVANMKGMSFIRRDGAPAFPSPFHEFRDFQSGLCKFQAVK